MTQRKLEQHQEYSEQHHKSDQHQEKLKQQGGGILPTHKMFLSHQENHTTLKINRAT